MASGLPFDGRKSVKLFLGVAFLSAPAKTSMENPGYETRTHLLGCGIKLYHGLLYTDPDKPWFKSSSPSSPELFDQPWNGLVAHRLSLKATNGAYVTT